MALIKLQDIWKSYPDGENNINLVLRGIDMEIETGEFVAIKGASGAGKTTLLSILGTMLTPDKGSYRLADVEMNTPGIDFSFVRNKQIGFVFQDHRLLPQYTAMENILLPTLAQKDNSRPIEEERARKLMELTNISQLENRYPSTLSGGEASRVAVCRALIMEPLLVLADEPTGQLDADNARGIARLLADINGKLQTTIIMVTHSDETSAVAHRILTLKEGLLQ
jgi:ABC-type lipoprotein export system ATPase subunit